MSRPYAERAQSGGGAKVPGAFAETDSAGDTIYHHFLSGEDISYDVLAFHVVNYIDEKGRVTVSQHPVVRLRYLLLLSIH